MITRTIYLKGTSQEKILLLKNPYKQIISVTIISPLMCSSIPEVSTMNPCAPRKGLLTPCCLLAMAQKMGQTTGY